MQTKIARWGNSLAVRLPAEVVRDLGFAEGQVVELTPKAPNLEIGPCRSERRFCKGIPVYTREELYAEMDRLGPGAEPELLDWGPDRGSEIIDDAYSRGEITPESLLKRDASRRR